MRGGGKRRKEMVKEEEKRWGGETRVDMSKGVSWLTHEIEKNPKYGSLAA